MLTANFAATVVVAVGGNRRSACVLHGRTYGLDVRCLNIDHGPELLYGEAAYEAGICGELTRRSDKASAVRVTPSLQSI